MYHKLSPKELEKLSPDKLLNRLDQLLAVGGNISASELAEKIFRWYVRPQVDMIFVGQIETPPDFYSEFDGPRFLIETERFSFTQAAGMVLFDRCELNYVLLVGDCDDMDGLEVRRVASVPYH